MGYKIIWRDATLTTNYKNEKQFIKEHNDMKITIEDLENDGEWYDYTAIHIFNADNDKEAKEYAKKYNFNGRDNDIFDLVRDNKIIMTEEDITDYKK